MNLEEVKRAREEALTYTYAVYHCSSIITNCSKVNAGKVIKQIWRRGLDERERNLIIEEIRENPELRKAYLHSYLAVRKAINFDYDNLPF